jgi:TonB family C-terminal domain
MGKIVKYCSSCDEGFAEKFGFCPDCGAPLQAFEMNPMTGEVMPEPKTPEIIASANDEIVEHANFDSFEAPATAEEEFYHEGETADVLKDDIIEEENGNGYHPEAVFEAPEAVAGEEFKASDTSVSDGGQYIPDDDFRVTLVEEKNSKQRNELLLGTLALMITLLLSGTVYSLFSKELGVGAIGEEDSIAYVGPVVDSPMEEEKPPQQKKNDAGGGGGGGNNEKTPASQGADAAMMEKPMVAPSAHMDRLTNPELTQQVGVKGPDQPKVNPYQNYGVKLGSLDGLSDGPGNGGGIGTGRGGGIGSGNGSGLGSGNGGGSGSGNGGGIGDGNGKGVGGGEPPPIRPAVTTALNILAKPRASYTDEARQNNVQGVVRLRVTFLASGQIGSISPVSTLPYGLTEQAIAAARNIRFEPKKVNGVAQSSVKQVEYSFSIY